MIFIIFVGKLSRAVFTKIFLSLRCKDLRFNGSPKAHEIKGQCPRFKYSLGQESDCSNARRD